MILNGAFLDVIAVTCRGKETVCASGSVCFGSLRTSFNSLITEKSLRGSANYSKIAEQNLLETQSVC